jgi:hypothetical protein
MMRLAGLNQVIVGSTGTMQRADRGWGGGNAMQAAASPR